MEINKIYQGDTLEVLKTFPNEFVDTIITSPPYWGLRDYGINRQIGLEPTLDEYLEKLLAITKELKRVLKPTGVMFWNHGDCYGGSWQNYGSREGGQREKNTKSFDRKDNPTNIFPPTAKLTSKCLALQNYRLLLKMIDEQGWILRNTIIWHKLNHMPSSVKDRFTNAYEPVYMLVKNQKYWFDLDAVREPHKYLEQDSKRKTFNLPKQINDKSNQVGKQRNGRIRAEDYHMSGKNPGDVWSLSTQPFPEAHFATFPEKLVEPMIRCACPKWICKKCGKARERIITTKYISHRKAKNLSHTRAKSIGKTHCAMDSQGKVCLSEHQTIGWTDCGCNAGWDAGIVLDPFMGAGTVAKVAKKLKRNWIGIELNPKYIDIANKRIKHVQMELL